MTPLRGVVVSHDSSMPDREEFSRMVLAQLAGLYLLLDHLERASCVECTRVRPVLSHSRMCVTCTIRREYTQRD